VKIEKGVGWGYRSEIGQTKILHRFIATTAKNN